MLPCHCKPKIYIYGFSKSAPTPRHTILDSRLPPCNVISEGRPPLSNTSSEAGALPLEGRIENDSDQIFSKSGGGGGANTKVPDMYGGGGVFSGPKTQK